jgi:hypothetical protein
VRVSEDDRSQPPDAEAAELGGDVRLGRPFVDEDVPFRHLQEDRVSLPHVERRDPEPVRRRRRRRMRPDAPNRGKGRDGEHAEDGDARPARTMESREDDERSRERAESSECEE